MPSATVMDEVNSSAQTLKERLVVLTKQLSEQEALKKASNKRFNDDIKDLKEEIKATLELIENSHE